jgi:hypothetical protein
MAENDIPAGGQETGGGDAPGSGESSRQDDIARAFDIVENRDAPPAPAPGPQAHPPVPAPAPGPGERARGPDGRFLEAPRAPKGAEAPPPAPTVKPAPPAARAPAAAPPKGPEAAPPPAPAQALRAPASWRPGAREHWAKLPPDVQQEVVRRETEVTRAVKESANARDALAHVQGVLGPFSHNIGASGTDALGMMQNLFQADNALRHGSVAEKATVIANIIKSYGVDLVTLDSVLAGQAPTSDPTTMMAERLRRELRAEMQPVMQYFSQMQGQRERTLSEINSNASGEVQMFQNEEGHEFFDDVRDLMADIIDLHTQRGATIGLQDAYDRAIKIHPQVSEILAKRAESERASAAAQAAQRARRTAVSLSSAPAPAGAAPGPAGDDRRAAIEAAFDQASNG